MVGWGSRKFFLEPREEVPIPDLPRDNKSLAALVTITDEAGQRVDYLPRYFHAKRRLVA